MKTVGLLAAWKKIGQSYVEVETCGSSTGPITSKNVLSGDFKTTFQQDFYIIKNGAEQLMYRVSDHRTGPCSH